MVGLLLISGRIRESSGGSFSEDTSVEAFEESVLGSRFDRHLGEAVSPDSSGRFAIEVGTSLGVNIRKVYLVVSDPARRFYAIESGQGEFVSVIDPHGRRKWKSTVIGDLENVDITVFVQRRPVPDDRYESVVIGSGFGGTIVALTLANRYAEDSSTPMKKVCVLERGQWWVSGEMPAKAGTTDGKPMIRQYLEEHNIPYGTWATPDDLSGFLRLLSSTRAMNPVKGVYDYRAMKNVGVISASGVGGGSLIYFNLTARPDHTTYENWAVQNDNDRPLDRKYSYSEVYGETVGREYLGELASANDKTLDYFDIAENFLGVNKITTTTVLGRFKLGKSSVFQRAATEVNLVAGDLMNPGNLDAELSITDVPYGTFGVENPTGVQRWRLSWQTNACERLGRCGIGCPPEARHTMSQRLYEAVQDGKPLDVFPLCPVDFIEENASESEFRYTVVLTDFCDDPKGVQRRVQAKTVVLAAGTLGSTEILLRSKNLRKSAAIGKNFSTNGDLFGIVSPTKDAVDAWQGPLLTSIARYRDKQTGCHEYSLEDLGIPKMFSEILSPLFGIMTLQKKAGSILPQTNLSDLLRRRVTDKMSSDPRVRDELLRLIDGFTSDSSAVLAEMAAKVRNGLNEIKLGFEMIGVSPEERLRNVLVLFGMGRDKSAGRLISDGTDLTLQEPYDLSQEVYGHLVDRMKLFARETGKDGESDLTMLFWDEGAKIGVTAHPLGGCPMGRDASEGVVDGLGRVYDSESGTSRHEGLYVADGSIIPTSLGVNPSLTICALAFRIAEEIAGDKRYWPGH